MKRRIPTDKLKKTDTSRPVTKIGYLYLFGFFPHRRRRPCSTGGTESRLPRIFSETKTRILIFKHLFELRRRAVFYRFDRNSFIYIYTHALSIKSVFYLLAFHVKKFFVRSNALRINTSPADTDQSVG